MSTQDYIFVNVSNGHVIGFEPGEIVQFLKERASFPHPDQIGFWPFFTYRFHDELNGNDALAFSVSWHFDTAWAELHRLCREAHVSI